MGSRGGAQHTQPQTRGPPIDAQEALRRALNPNSGGDEPTGAGADSGYPALGARPGAVASWQGGTGHTRTGGRVPNTQAAEDFPTLGGGASRAAPALGSYRPAQQAAAPRSYSRATKSFPSDRRYDRNI